MFNRKFFGERVSIIGIKSICLQKMYVTWLI